jgi:cyclic pyranopterin phosphate synthase
MVDVGRKDDTEREAVAKAKVIMKPSTLEQIRTVGLKKGDVLAVARVAGIMAAKKTSDLIPLCHPIPIEDIAIDLDFSGNNTIEITARVNSKGKTGVEMEALTAASEVYLESKKGGKSGTYLRKGKA